MTSPNLPAFLPKAVPSSSNPRLYYSPPPPASPYPMQRPMQISPAFEFHIPTSHPLYWRPAGNFWQYWELIKWWGLLESTRHSWVVLSLHSQTTRACRRDSGTHVVLLETKCTSASFSWVENSSMVSTPDGSSPGAMSWPGHFLSGGLVLIKAWTNGNAPCSPTSPSLCFFYNSLCFDTPQLAENLRNTYFSFLPHFPSFCSFVPRIIAIVYTQQCL